MQKNAHGPAIGCMLGSLLATFAGCMVSSSSRPRFAVLLWVGTVFACFAGSVLWAERVHRWWVGVLAFFSGVVLNVLALGVFLALGFGPGTPTVTSGNAVKLTLGAHALSIPVPIGYFDAFRSDQPIAKRWLESSAVAEGNARLVFFLPQNESILAMDNAGLVVRSYDVQILKQNIEADVPTGYFAGEASLMKREIQSVFGMAERGQDDLIAKQSMGVDSVDGRKVFPVHFERPDAVACSTIWTIRREEVAGNPVAIDLAVTMSMVELKGKILILYVRSPARDLEWTRTESIRWLDSIIAANP